MKRLILSVIFVASLASLGAAEEAMKWSGHEDEAPRILLVVAHPDDEYDMAATVYRIATELHGVVDEIIITDGASGYRYSTLAERYYGMALTDETSSRARLARIRVEESRRAARILGIRHQWFLHETNIPFTKSVDSPLHSSWNTKRILQSVSQRLKEGHYDFLFVVLPDADTHGEHKAAAILALEATHSLPVQDQPIVLGAAAENTSKTTYSQLPGQPLTQTLSSQPEYHFDRNTKFGYQQSLSYQIVVDWVIAEHKSQGLFQTKCLQDRFENFWIFRSENAEARTKTASLFSAIAPVSSRRERMTELSSAFSTISVGAQSL
jgi:N-acetylglucosamine malate deacetylase 2